MECPLHRILVERDHGYIVMFITKIRDFMTQSYNQHLINFIRLLDHFADKSDHGNQCYSIFIILAVLNREQVIKQSVISQSPNVKKIEGFFIALSGSFEALSNRYFTPSAQLIETFVTCCKGQYIIS